MSQRTPAAEAPPRTQQRTHTVLVYSDDAAVREQVWGVLGRRPAPDLGRLEWIECATGDQVVSVLDAGGIDLCVLDGEAWPTGGTGLAKQLKDELPDCPPVLLLIARRADTWLASWSQADGVVAHPLDAPELLAVACGLLRDREAGVPVRRALH